MAKTGKIEMWQVWLDNQTIITGISYPPPGSQKEPNENQVRLSEHAFCNVLSGAPFAELVKQGYKWVGRGSAEHTALLVKGYVESCVIEVGKDPYG